MKVKIKHGFATGLIGEVTRTYPNGVFEVTIKYEEDMPMYDIRKGEVDRLAYDANDLEFLEEGEYGRPE